jgi:hypothetical protein
MTYVPDSNVPPQPQPDQSTDQAPMLQQSSSLPADVNNALASNSQANPDPHVSRWRAVLRGALAGLIEGGIPGAAIEATQGAVDPKTTYRNLGMQQAARQSSFDIQKARAANSVAVAAQNAFKAQHMDEEWQRDQADHALQQMSFLKSQGITPTRVISDTGQDTTATLKDMTANGQMPHVLTVHSPGSNGMPGSIAIYNMDDVTKAPQLPSIINETRGYANRPQLTNQQFAAMSPADKEDAATEAHNFWNPQNVTPQNVQSVVARYQGYQRAWEQAHRGDPTYQSVMGKFDNTIKHLQDTQAGFDRHELNQKTALARATAEQKAEVKEDHAPAPSEEWKPKATADERKKAGLAENIAENSNYIGNLLLKSPNLVGAVSGRFTSVEQMMGTNDPAISGLGTAIHNIAMANSGVHGFRSQEGVKETENLLLNQFKNGPQAIAGALIALTNSTQTFIDIARPEGYKTHSKQGGARKGMRQ